MHNYQPARTSKKPWRFSCHLASGKVMRFLGGEKNRSRGITFFGSFASFPFKKLIQNSNKASYLNKNGAKM